MQILVFQKKKYKGQKIARNELCVSRLVLIGRCILMYCGSDSGTAWSASRSMGHVVRKSKTFGWATPFEMNGARSYQQDHIVARGSEVREEKSQRLYIIPEEETCLPLATLGVASELSSSMTRWFVSGILHEIPLCMSPRVWRKQKIKRLRLTLQTVYIWLGRFALGPAPRADKCWTRPRVISFRRRLMSSFIVSAGRVAGIYHQMTLSLSWDLISVQTRLLADDHFQTINWTKVCSIEISAVLISTSSPSDICNIKPTAESNNQKYFFKNDIRLLQHH